MWGSNKHCFQHHGDLSRSSSSTEEYEIERADARWLEEGSWRYSWNVNKSHRQGCSWMNSFAARHHLLKQFESAQSSTPPARTHAHICPVGTMHNPSARSLPSFLALSWRRKLLQQRSSRSWRWRHIYEPPRLCKSWVGKMIHELRQSVQHWTATEHLIAQSSQTNDFQDVACIANCL